MSNIIDPVFIFGAKYLYLVLIAIFFIWFLAQPRARKGEVLIIICISLPLIFIISEIAGRLYYNPRPFVVGNFEPLISHKSDNGFPSHHALLASAISTIVFIFNRRTGIVLWALALFVGSSRVYAGVHHIIDIAGGILISIISTVLVYVFVKHLKIRGLFIFKRKAQ
ncbi:MAG: phosphatase PAP2 family protein [Candidatus Omnitrophica bacterium]|nr:phosphatase PAP2 family protein [Candidatus Omnitrophota bacterium]